jgi:hypothetical protein
MSAVGRTRTNLAVHHLLAACRFAGRVAKLEDENIGQPLGQFWDEILQNGLGAATLAVASLEAYANEMYFEGEILTPTINSVMAQELAEMIDRESILRKYALALALRKGERLDMGGPSVQNADALIRLRNAIVHFRPEWFGEERGRHERLSSILRPKF